MPKTFDSEVAVRTERRTQLVDVTDHVSKLVRESGIERGICYLFVSHTTAGVILNEHDDPDVARDIEATLDRLVPKDHGYRHAEGNADSHIKTALMGNSATILIAGGELDLGRWQGIFFCEFDGPRRRTLRVRVVSDGAENPVGE